MGLKALRVEWFVTESITIIRTGIVIIKRKKTQNL